MKFNWRQHVKTLATDDRGGNGVIKTNKGKRHCQNIHIIDPRLLGQLWRLRWTFWARKQLNITGRRIPMGQKGTGIFFPLCIYGKGREKENNNKYCKVCPHDSSQGCYWLLWFNTAFNKFMDQLSTDKSFGRTVRQRKSLSPRLSWTCGCFWSA